MAKLSKKERVAKQKRKERRLARKAKRSKGKGKVKGKSKEKKNKKGKKVDISNVSGYCVKCRAKRPMEGVKVVKSKTGMNMAKGACKKCGCKMCKILGKA